MNHSLTCPSCGRTIKCSAESVGKKGKCPKCDAVFVVPSPSSEHNNASGQLGLNCSKCGQQLRPLVRNGHSLERRICATCDVEVGICPECKSSLRTETAEQCPKCKVSWRRTREHQSVENKVQFKCPSCEEHINTTSLSTLMAPISDTSFNPGFEVLTPIVCPSCAEKTPAWQVNDLSGEIVFACPFCCHRMLRPRLSFRDVVLCGACKKGFSGGLVNSYVGTFVPSELPDNVPESPEERCVTAHVACVQTTETTNSQAFMPEETLSHIVTHETLFSFWQPTTGKRRITAGCKLCGQTLNFTIHSRRSAVSNQCMIYKWIMAAAGVGAVLAAALVIYSVVTGNDLGIFGAIAILGFGLGVVGVAPTVSFLIWRWQGYPIETADLVELSSAASAHDLYFNPGVLSGSSARLILDHKLEAKRTELLDGIENARTR